MAKPFRGRLSYRDTLLRNKNALDFIAAAADKKHEFSVPIPPAPRAREIRRPVDGKPAVPLEKAVNDDIYDAFAKRPDVRLWRNNRGVAQYGNKMVTYGVGPRGASDWIGYRKVRITAEMVGTEIAQFCALEAKRPGERPDDDQQRFIDRVNADGGIAGWADSAEKAKALLP